MVNIERKVNDLINELTILNWKTSIPIILKNIKNDSNISEEKKPILIKQLMIAHRNIKSAIKSLGFLNDELTK